MKRATAHIPVTEEKNISRMRKSDQSAGGTAAAKIYYRIYRGNPFWEEIHFFQGGNEPTKAGGEYAPAHPTKSPHLTVSVAQMRGNATRSGGNNLQQTVEIMRKLV